MKKMLKKNTIIFAVAAFVLCLLVCATTACGNDNGGESGDRPVLTDEQKTAYGIIGYESGLLSFVAGCDAIIINDGDTVADYLQKLADDNIVDISYTEGKYGWFITAINGTAASANEFWAIYTDDAAHSDTAWGTYKVDGKDLGSASFGASSLPVVSGCIYAFVLQ